MEAPWTAAGHFSPSRADEDFAELPGQSARWCRRSGRRGRRWPHRRRVCVVSVRIRPRRQSCIPRLCASVTRRGGSEAPRHGAGLGGTSRGRCATAPFAVATRLSASPTRPTMRWTSWGGRRPRRERMKLSSGRPRGCRTTSTSPRLRAASGRSGESPVDTIWSRTRGGENIFICSGLVFWA